MFIHLYRHEEIYHLIQIIKKYLEAKIIAAHCFGLELFMKEYINYLKHVYFDIRIMKAIKHFGSKRILMG